VSSCGKKNYKTSRHGDNKSHFEGSTCISCHMPGGSAKEAFSVCGSVYDEVRLKVQPGAVVKLYTQPKAQGKLVATLNTDNKGNFYTTQKIDLSKGVYATLLGTPGVKEDTKHMPHRIFNGDCNSCHGVFTETLGID
jgi:mono/diheme cytochrome c family protein